MNKLHVAKDAAALMTREGSDAKSRCGVEGSRNAASTRDIADLLQELAGDLGWFLANGAVTSIQAKQLSRAREQPAVELFSNGSSLAK